MSVFVPFKAYRPTKDAVEQVSSRPYDVLNTEEARAESAGNPNSYYRVIKPEIDFPEGQDPYDPAVYARGKENLQRLINQGLMQQDDVESFYVYRLKMGDHVQTGLVGCCSIDDYFNNVIKKHELTKPRVEDDRKQHVVISEFNYEPVFFSYHGVDEIDTIVEQATQHEPLYDFVSGDGVHHMLWAIDDPDTTSMITRIFEQHVDAIYIADGHHRTAAGSLGGRDLRDAAGANGTGEHRYGYLMSVLFPEREVRIMDYNRVVRDLNGMSPDAFLAQLQRAFDVEAQAGPYRPESHQTIGMYLDGKWYRLVARESTFDPEDPVDALGFTILSKQVLEPLLNIVDLRRDKRIDFVGGIRGLAELERRVDSGEMAVAFAMHPISMEQLMHISDEGLILPPKVTWFEPKLRSGLFAHDLRR
ncbi:MAG: DUF1015 family protein [Saprospiraceae bacterium]|nr:DUF1015 family protein [Saprospiraceae bacterium]